MVTVGMNYQVLPGKNEPFESVFNKVLQVMGEMEGHKETHLFRDVNNGQNYLIVSEWYSRAAFDAFTQSERFRSVTNWGKEQILAGRPKHEVYGQDESRMAAPAASAGKCPVQHG